MNLLEPLKIFSNPIFLPQLSICIEFWENLNQKSQNYQKALKQSFENLQLARREIIMKENGERILT